MSVKLAMPRRRIHPFDLGGALLFDFRGEPEELLRRAEEAAWLGRENSLPFLTLVLAPIHSGIALIRQGKFAEGTVSLKTSLALYEGGGGGVAVPYWKSVLAKGVAQLGDLEGAFCLIDEVVAQIERSGWEVAGKSVVITPRSYISRAGCSH